MVTFEQFAHSRQRSLLRFGFALTASREDAEDLVQSALAKAYPRWSRIDDPEAYVKRSMVNANINRGRWGRRERLMAAPRRTNEDPSADEAVVLRDQMWRLLAALTPRQRAVLVLRYMEDLSEAESARMLGCSVGTVKSQTHKAIAKLRFAYEAADQDAQRLGGRHA